MRDRQAALKELLLVTKDGEWGKSEPANGLVAMTVIRGTDFLRVRFGSLDKVPVRYIPKAVAERKRLQPGDILIETAGGTRDQSTGRTVLLTKRIFAGNSREITCASFSRFLRVNPEVAEPAFVYWFLQCLHATGQMEAHQVQHTGIARFQYTKFAESTQIPLPPLAEQRAIARVLGTLDDKIELNRRMNETLGTVVQGLFKKFFFDFSIKGLPPSWREMSFKEILAPSTARVGSAQLPEYSATVTGLFPRRDRFKKQLAKSQANNRRISAGDLVFGLSRRVINFGLMREKEGAVSPVYEIFKIDESIIEPGLLEHFIRTHMSQYMDILKPGAREGQAIDREHLLRKRIAIPDRETQNQFLKLRGPLARRIGINEAESQTLTALRDALLPKLLSGQVRVRGL